MWIRTESANTITYTYKNDTYENENNNKNSP